MPFCCVGALILTPMGLCPGPAKGLCPPWSTSRPKPQQRRSLCNPFVGEVGREGDGRRVWLWLAPNRRPSRNPIGPGLPSRPASPVKGSKGSALGGVQGQSPWPCFTSPTLTLQPILDIRISLCHFLPMDALLTALRAAAEPTRLRLLALAARGAFCVMEFTEILGQSQPRPVPPSEAAVRVPACWTRVTRRRQRLVRPPDRRPDGALARELARPPAGGRPDPGGRPPPGRPRAGRARPRRLGELPPPGRRLGRDARSRPAGPGGRGRAAVADPGRRAGPLARHRHRHRPRAGTAGAAGARRGWAWTRRRPCWRWPAPAWPAPGWRTARCGCADMYRLPLADASFDIAVLQMVLHYAEDPAGVLAEAARVLRPGGAADRHRPGATRPGTTSSAKLAHRWPGFSDTAMSGPAGGNRPRAGRATGQCPVRWQVRIWPAIPTRRRRRRPSRTRHWQVYIE